MPKYKVSGTMKMAVECTVDAEDHEDAAEKAINRMKDAEGSVQLVAGSGVKMTGMANDDEVDDVTEI